MERGEVMERQGGDFKKGGDGERKGMERGRWLREGGDGEGEVMREGEVMERGK